jgi:phosphoribulokinase
LMWHTLGDNGDDMPECLGQTGPDGHSTPLAVTQMVLFHHLLRSTR